MHGHAARPRFLAFSRNYLIPDFRASFAPLSREAEVVYLTDAASDLADADTRADFYAALRSGARSADLSDDQVADISARCRLLRNIDAAQARRLVHAMGMAMGRAIDRFRPVGVISQMVDEYVSHTLQVVAANRGLGYVGYCAGYFPGTSLLLADASGRPLEWRSVDDAEATARLESVAGRQFRQTYNLGAGYSLKTHLVKMARYRVKRIWFALKGRLERDRWNLHYRVTPYIAERRHLSDYPAATLFAADWQAKLSQLRAARPGRRVVYMPLSYFPESTIDYWVGDTRAIAYERTVLDMVGTLARTHIVVVKEHLHMMGARPAALLKALHAMDNVVSAHPLAFSNEIVEASDITLLGSGSPGIEATLRGRPVATFCDTSYWHGPARATLLRFADLPDWGARIDRAIDAHRPLDDEAARAFVAACLASSTRTVPGGRIWPVLDPQDAAALLRHVAEGACAVSR